MANEIWIYAEAQAEGLTDLTKQCLARGAELSAASGAALSAVLVGGAGALPALQVAGVTRVLHAQDDRLANYTPLAYEHVLVEALQTQSPRLLIVPASSRGNDLAAGVAQRLGASCILNCSEIELAGEAVVGRRAEYEGNATASYSASGPLTVVTAREGIADATTADSATAPTVEALPVSLDASHLSTEIVGQDLAARTVNLKEASIIVAAGAGVGSKENFALVEELAAAVGGEVGATRAAVDAGWTTLDRQIGQTGETVKPDLYFACGISGAVQHRVGMQDSKCIVAINIDPGAPIFRYSHYCLVGDLVEVIPQLVKLWQG